jgi:hypothetical protein
MNISASDAAYREKIKEVIMKRKTNRTYRPRAVEIWLAKSWELESALRKNRKFYLRLCQQMTHNSETAQRFDAVLAIILDTAAMLADPLRVQSWERRDLARRQFRLMRDLAFAAGKKYPSRRIIVN